MQLVARGASGAAAAAAATSRADQARYPPSRPRLPAGNMLQGPDGTEVVLRVQPGGSGGAPRDVRVAREPIAFNPVDYALCGSSGEGAGPAERAGRGAAPRCGSRGTRC
jgi:hypothetical protein